MFQLVMRSGPNPGKTFELSEGEATIGRDITNAIVINDAEVSRRHARLSPQAGGYVLEDLGSTNGTFVNGQRLMGPHLLRPGELVLLGENVSLAYEQIA
jgi:pSer/pThr/pTyr-binding forkhead associated (FHA) protein